jgi:ParB-like chromosome segregation protein Spo0J
VTIQQTLERLKAAMVQQLPLASVQTDDALQPREGRMVPFRDQARTDRRSEEHTGIMRLALEAAHHRQLEPVLVAEIDGALFVVDGHHRLKAYRRALRETIPARVYPMDRATAVLVSKLVNCDERALEMHAEQRRDAAWQYLAAVTRRGAERLPTGESLRAIAGRFGVSRDTIGRMVKQLPKVNPKEWNSEAHDPGTGFPRWRYVRESKGGWHGMKQETDVEQITQQEAEKLAKKIGAPIDKANPEAVRRAVRMLGIEAVMEASNPDSQSFTAETTEAGDY